MALLGASDAVINPLLDFVQLVNNVPFIRSDLVAAAGMVNKKTGPPKCPKDGPWFERGQFCAHAASTATLTVSLTGRSLIFLSDGIGSLSLRRLSR